MDREQLSPFLSKRRLHNGDLELVLQWFRFGNLIRSVCIVTIALGPVFFPEFRADLTPTSPQFGDALAWLGIASIVTYVCLVYVLNSSRITVSVTGLRVSVGPLPWLGGRSIQRTAIRQLFCEPRVIRRKKGSLLRFDLKVLTTTGRRLSLVNRIDEVRVASTLEKEIEKKLGLQDRPVAGEITKIAAGEMDAYKRQEAEHRRRVLQAMGPYGGLLKTHLKTRGLDITADDIDPPGAVGLDPVPSLSPEETEWLGKEVEKQVFIYQRARPVSKVDSSPSARQDRPHRAPAPVAGKYSYDDVSDAARALVRVQVGIIVIAGSVFAAWWYFLRTA